MGAKQSKFNIGPKVGLSLLTALVLLIAAGCATCPPGSPDPYYCPEAYYNDGYYDAGPQVYYNYTYYDDRYTDPYYYRRRPPRRSWPPPPRKKTQTEYKPAPQTVEPAPVIDRPYSPPPRTKTQTEYKPAPQTVEPAPVIDRPYSPPPRGGAGPTPIIRRPTTVRSQ